MNTKYSANLEKGVSCTQFKWPDYSKYDARLGDLIGWASGIGVQQGELNLLPEAFLGPQERVQITF